MTTKPVARAPAPSGVGDSLSERAYRQLEEQIVTLKIPPGAMVTEAALAQSTGFGRTPIREAIQRLARERLLVIKSRRGILVSEVDVHAQLRLLAVRRELERLVARDASIHASDEERCRLNAIAAAMEAAGAANDDRTFMRLDREFNLLCLDAARNEFAAGAMSLMHGLSRRFWYIHYREAADLPLAARRHADVARAIAAADPETAAAASDRLMDYIAAFTRAAAGESR